MAKSYWNSHLQSRFSGRVIDVRFHGRLLADQLVRVVLYAAHAFLDRQKFFTLQILGNSVILNEKAFHDVFGHIEDKRLERRLIFDDDWRTIPLFFRHLGDLHGIHCWRILVYITLDVKWIFLCFHFLLQEIEFIENPYYNLQRAINLR